MAWLHNKRKYSCGAYVIKICQFLPISEVISFNPVAGWTICFFLSPPTPPPGLTCRQGRGFLSTRKWTGSIPLCFPIVSQKSSQKTEQLRNRPESKRALKSWQWAEASVPWVWMKLKNPLLSGWNTSAIPAAREILWLINWILWVGLFLEKASGRWIKRQDEYWESGRSGRVRWARGSLTLLRGAPLDRHGNWCVWLPSTPQKHIPPLWSHTDGKASSLPMSAVLREKGTTGILQQLFLLEKKIKYFFWCGSIFVYCKLQDKSWI